LKTGEQISNLPTSLGEIRALAIMDGKAYVGGKFISIWDVTVCDIRIS
jgi:hypothetical protein